MTAATRFFHSLIRLEIDLWNVLDARLQAEHDLSLGRLQALRVVHDRGRCRVLDIAGDLRITVGAASKLVDRLEQDGTARREPNPDDRRSSLIALTADGRRLHDAAAETFEASLRSSLPSGLGDDELDLLSGRFERMHRHLRDSTEAVTA